MEGLAMSDVQSEGAAVVDRLADMLREAAMSGDMPLGQAFDAMKVSEELERLRTQRDWFHDRYHECQAAANKVMAALLMLERWDMLTLNDDGKGAVCADAPWARALIADSLKRMRG